MEIKRQQLAFMMAWHPRLGESALILKFVGGLIAVFILFCFISLLVLDLLLDVLDGVAALNLKSDGLASQRLDEDLHAAAESQHQVKRALLLDLFSRC